MSTARRKPYPFDTFEPRWQQHWQSARTFHAPNPGEPGFDASKPKYYVLDMFPYPSGAGLHVGHPEGYTATDIIARYKRMRGFNVLHPMGWDAFGLPAEQYAIKTGQHPRVTTEANVATFRAQLQRIGFAYDWQREVNTTDPAYFRWTQWIFLQLYGSWCNPDTQRAEPVSSYKGADVDSVRLAYVSEAPVNWCPALGTVLANEEVIDGKSEVGGHPVERRPMRQWMLRITAFAQRLIDELEGLDWPEGIRLLQKNWIGRSEGAEVRFRIAESEQSIPVFTTRPDTLYGATYMVLAPEHGLVDAIVTGEQWPAVREYRERTARKSDLERTELAKEKTGVWTGAFAINPVNGERIPIWIADYVLLGYGTGAIMAVPAHDERDWEFARKYALPIREVVSPSPALGLGGGESPCSAEPLECFTGEGWAIHSGPLDGLPTGEAKADITRRLEALGLGKKTINFKLRDWLFSRQRYWGEPFPIVWENGKHRPLAESELPLTPPELADFKPTGTGEPPLARAGEWLRYSEKATRETNTMPQWAGSCWYYLRYCDPGNGSAFVGREAERFWMTGQTGAVSGNGDKTAYARETSSPCQGDELPMPEKASAHAGETSSPCQGDELPMPGKESAYAGEKSSPCRGEELPMPEKASAHAREGSEMGDGRWEIGSGPNSELRTPNSELRRPPNRGGVDLYVGGTEHAVLHLLYARFWHKVLFDLGHVSTPEPFQRLVNQGLILGEDGQKMSKSRGNVVNPDEVIAEYGADALRCYEMFMGPLEAVKPWSMTGVEGVARFLARVWRLVMEEGQDGVWRMGAVSAAAEPDRGQLRLMHASVKKVTGDIEALAFNTAISTLMVLTNAFVNVQPRPAGAVRLLLVLLNPFAPHITEELWAVLNAGLGEERGHIADAAWPVWDEAFLIEDEVEIVLQVNGKVRDKMVVKRDATREEVEAAARASARIAEWTAGKEIRKVVVVPGKLVNVVVA